MVVSLWHLWACGAVVNAINLDGGGSATMTQNHSLVSDPSWLCTTGNSKSLFRCEKPVTTITCIHAAPPPVFLPLESTWANYTNITQAAEAAEEVAQAQTRVRQRKELCAGYNVVNASGNGTLLPPLSVVEAEALAYKRSTWILTCVLIVSLLMNVQHPWVMAKVGKLLGMRKVRPLKDGLDLQGLRFSEARVGVVVAGFSADPNSVLLTHLRHPRVPPHHGSDAAVVLSAWALTRSWGGVEADARAGLTGAS